MSVEIDGEVVAIDPDDGVHLISATGALLWPFLDGTVSLSELADDVSVVFGVGVDQALQDVAEFAVSAVAAGLLEEPHGS